MVTNDLFIRSSIFPLTNSWAGTASRASWSIPNIQTFSPTFGFEVLQCVCVCVCVCVKYIQAGTLPLCLALISCFHRDSRSAKGENIDSHNPAHGDFLDSKESVWDFRSPQLASNSSFFSFKVFWLTCCLPQLLSPPQATAILNNCW